MKLKIQIFLAIIGLCSLVLFACGASIEEEDENPKVNTSAVSDSSIGVAVDIENKREHHIWLDSAHFPDEYLREFLKEQADLNKDGELNEDELMELETLQIKKKEGILDLTGIGFLMNVRSLLIKANKVKNVEELEKAVQIHNLCIDVAEQISIDIPSIPTVTKIKVHSTTLKRLNIEFCENLEEVVLCAELIETLELGSSKVLKKINLGEMPKLKSFGVDNSSLNSIDFEKMPNLKKIFITGAQNITAIDISANKNIVDFYWTNGKLKKIKWGSKDKLQVVDISNNRLAGKWNLEKFPQLSKFVCDDNAITQIFAGNHKSLSELSCKKNQLKEVNLSYVSNLIIFSGKGNPDMDLYLPYDEPAFFFDKTARVYYKEEN